MLTKGKKAKKSASKASEESRMQKIADGIQEVGDKLRNQLGDRFGKSSLDAKMMSADVMISLIKMQSSAVDRVFKVVGNLQKRGGKVLKQYLEKADWAPSEAKDIIKEWDHMLNTGREDFQKTLDKSYGLLRTFFERVRKEEKAASKKAPAKAAVAAKKKTTAKMNVRKPSEAQKPAAML